MTLRAENLAYAFPETPEALISVTAQAQPGKLTAVIGPNAAGKTTLLRILLGLLTPRAGTAFVHDRPVLSIPPRQRARLLAYVAQRPVVDASFTVRQVVALGRYATGPSSAGIHHALGICDLADLADRDFHELSVGQQQLVALARALAQIDGSSPSGKAMLLDEPTAALDPRHALAVMNILRDLAARGCAVLAVFHDLMLAARFADEVWALSGGRIVAAGPRSDVLTPRTLESVYHTPFVLTAEGLPLPTITATST